MPTYDYQCEKCKKGFEAFQSMKDEAFKTCPKELCQQKTWGKGKVRRLLGTGAGLIFKGSGFYTTDYRSEGYKSGAAKDAPPAAKEAPKESGTAASTPPAPKPAAPETKPKGGAKKA